MDANNQDISEIHKFTDGKKRFSKAHLWPLVTLLLAIALLVAVLMWKPWQPNIKASERTISVTGQATITADPDEFVFSPSYDFTDNNKQAALDALSKKNDEIVAKLKALGVPDNKIANSSSGYENGIYAPIQDGSGAFTYNLRLTVTVNDKVLAQKVQDYLVSTGPTGSVSPQADFSKAKQKQIESQARGKAETDARTNANQSASNLGFKVDKVKSVEGDGFNNIGGGCGGFSRICAGAVDLNTSSQTSPSLSFQPGQNDLSYSVKVVYYIH